MHYTWDAKKNADNLKLRGFDFAFAALIFDGVTFARADERRNYGEPRTIAIGGTQGLLLTVVFTDRVRLDGELERRIISARRSNRNERQAYQKAIEND